MMLEDLWRVLLDGNLGTVPTTALPVIELSIFEEDGGSTGAAGV